MIHGGGHIMLSRKDVRPKQTQHLLKNGYLPVSLDYRLCPEVNLVDGPMMDVCDALQWARKTLPDLSLRYPGLRIEGDKVVVVGWSTGGTLAMSLAWTSVPRGIKPPDAILAFYCPTDYAAACKCFFSLIPLTGRMLANKVFFRLEATQYSRRLCISREQRLRPA